jgi:hypothetical protein
MACYTQHAAWALLKTATLSNMSFLGHQTIHEKRTIKWPITCADMHTDTSITFTGRRLACSMMYDLIVEHRACKASSEEKQSTSISGFFFCSHVSSTTAFPWQHILSRDQVKFLLKISSSDTIEVERRKDFFSAIFSLGRGKNNETSALLRSRQHTDNVSAKSWHHRCRGNGPSLRTRNGSQIIIRHQSHRSNNSVLSQDSICWGHKWFLLSMPQGHVHFPPLPQKINGQTLSQKPLR